MWSSFIRFVSRHRLAAIMLSGLLVFTGSGLTTFFWANYPGESPGSMVKQRQQATQSANPGSASSDHQADTPQLSPGNWESFLAYEGPRERMLGIKQSYDVVNFRRGPGIENRRIARPGGGTLLEPLDHFNEWYRARLPSGQVGWIHESLVRQLDVPRPVVREVTTDYPPLKQSTRKLVPDSYWNHNRVRITAEAVNVRQGPGTQFRLIGRSYHYEQLRLFARQGNWYRIKTITGNPGWIYHSYAEPVWENKENKPDTVTLPSGSLRPGPEYRLRETEVSQNSIRANVIASSGEWYQVQLKNGNIGWVTKGSVLRSK